LVLFFVPVGAKRLDLMKGNVLALKKSYPQLFFYFCHYDGLEGQKVYAKEKWYNEHVANHWCAYKGLKAEFVFKELVARDQLTKEPWLKQFPLVWFAVSTHNFPDSVFLNLFLQTRL
jgi:hypothetical protein